MSVEVGTAYLTVVPSAKGFAGKLQSQLGGGMTAAGARAGDQFGEGFKSKVKTVAKSAFAGLLGGGAALGGLAVLGIKTAAANEQAQISFTTMLGSAKKAQGFLSKLQSFAASTPFEFPELQTAASSLISAGINADKVIPIMRTLGDVTSGMGTGSEGVQRATIALQQMSAAGRITGEDLNQLRDAGIPVYDLLAKATGKSKAQVVALAQAGKLGKKELGQMMKALETGKGLERFSGLMDKQSASLTGLFSTFKDTLGQGLAKAVEPLIPLLKDGLGAASEHLAAIIPKVSAALLTALTATKNFVTDFKAGEGVAGKFRSTLETVISVVQNVATFLKDNATAVQILGGALLGGLVAFKAITTAVKIYTGVQALLNVVLAANPIGIVVIAIAALVGGMIVAYKKSETFRNIVDTVFGALKKVWGVLMENKQAFLVLLGPVGLLAAALITAYKKSETFRNIVKGAFEAVGAAARFMWNNVVAPVIRFLLGAFTKVTEFYAALLRGLSKIPGFGWAKGAADKLQTVADKAAGIKNAIHDIPDKKTVDVSVNFKPTSGRIKVGSEYVNVGQRATGGPVAAGRPYIVGEHEPELFVPKTAGTILNQSQMAQAGAGGTVTLSRASIQSLAAEMANVTLHPTISAGSVDRAVGGTLR